MPRSENIETIDIMSLESDKSNIGPIIIPAAKNPITDGSFNLEKIRVQAPATSMRHARLINSIVSSKSVLPIYCFASCSKASGRYPSWYILFSFFIRQLTRYLLTHHESIHLLKEFVSIILLTLYNEQFTPSSKRRI